MPAGSHGGTKGYGLDACVGSLAWLAPTRHHETDASDACWLVQLFPAESRKVLADHALRAIVRVGERVGLHPVASETSEAKWIRP